jgi:glycosyltransferase involved in cell wall biosynthesis
VIWLGFGAISYELVPLKESSTAPVVLETDSVWSRFILRELPFAQDAAQRERILREGKAKQAEERFFAQQVDLTTAVSEVDVEYFRSIAPEPANERVMLQANVIDVDAYARVLEPDLKLERPALLFSGTLSHGTANVDAALWLLDQVMPSVWRQRPGVHVYVVGSNPTPAVVARRSPLVHVTGRVASIVPYMRASVAAVVPLRWESGTRFKILEAFACRTPVISTTLGAEGLNVEHDRHLLLADDARGFAEAILAILDQPSLGQRLVGPAYDLVKREYDLGSAERQIEAILCRLGFGARVEA